MGGEGDVGVVGLVGGDSERVTSWAIVQAEALMARKLAAPVGRQYWFARIWKLEQTQAEPQPVITDFGGHCGVTLIRRAVTSCQTLEVEQGCSQCEVIVKRKIARRFDTEMGSGDEKHQRQEILPS